MRTLGWESLNIKRKKAKAKIMYTMLNEMGLKLLSNLFSYNVCLPKPSTNNMKNCFMHDEGKTWNSIPKDIRKSKSIPSFQK